MLVLLSIASMAVHYTFFFLSVCTVFCYAPKFQGGTSDAVLYMYFRPALMAYLDARPADDQEVAGSTLARSTTLFCGD